MAAALRDAGVWWRRKSVQEARHRAIAFALIIVGAAFTLLPLVWMVSASLSTKVEVMMYPPRWIPKRLLFSNYLKAVTIIEFGMYFRNTVVMTLEALVGEVLTASLVAFGFARLRSRSRDVLFIVLLSTMMMPYHVQLIPTYLLFRYLGWLDTFLPLVVPGWFGGGAFYIFLLRQFYATLPRELDDAAQIDGCGAFGVYWRILLPLSKPALATVAIFSFFSHWSDFLGPLIFLSRPKLYTLSLGLQFYVTAMGQVQWHLLMAATLLTLLPPVFMFFISQKTFVQGIALTGLKY